MISTLDFSKGADGIWEATFISTGKAVVQLERRQPSTVWARASIPGMEDVPIAQYNNEYGPNIIFEIRQPAGVEVTIRSRTDVVRGKVLTREKGSGDGGGGGETPDVESLTTDEIDSIIGG